MLGQYKQAMPDIKGARLAISDGLVEKRTKVGGVESRRKPSDYWRFRDYLGIDWKYIREKRTHLHVVQSAIIPTLRHDVPRDTPQFMQLSYNSTCTQVQGSCWVCMLSLIANIRDVGAVS